MSRRHRRGTKGKVAAMDAEQMLALVKGECSKDLQDDLKNLRTIIGGGPEARNAQARIKAIQLKWAYALGLPTQKVEASGEGGLLEMLLASMQPTPVTEDTTEVKQGSKVIRFKKKTG